MTFPKPFDYEPRYPPVGRGSVYVLRQYEPDGYENFQSYKPWLRDEFTFRCVYCLFRERWYGSGSECFSVDHLIPQSAARGGEFECKYTNLAYSCMHCNSCRGAVEILNPNVDHFPSHLMVNEQDGWIEGLSHLGKKTIRLLKLNHPPFIERRRRSFSILSLKAEFPSHPKVHELFVQEFGFPDDLPDLRSLKPPNGNLMNNEGSCYYVRRERGELPEVY
jgi:hypothetical protein